MNILCVRTWYSREGGRCKSLFAGLSKLLENTELEESFSRILPHAVQICLHLPARVTQPVPLLKRGENGSVTLGQRQIASLLANAMFCTFPGRGRSQTRHTSECASFHDANFTRMYAYDNDIKVRYPGKFVNYPNFLKATHHE